MFKRRRAWSLVILALGAVLALVVAACGGTDEGSAKAPALTVYNGQHPELAQSLATAFTKDSGIKVELRSGDGADLANQIQEEGGKTKADVLLTEDPGPAAMLDQGGLLAKVEPASLADVDRRLVPSSGNWLPYAARARVIFYNPKLIGERDLPRSVLDLTEPRWKGKFAYAPSGAFAATTSYLISTIGPEKTLAWLKGIKANGVNEQKNGKVRDTVEAGQHPFGLSNHYYWWILAGERGGGDKLASEIHYFDHPDAGGLLLASSAAIPKNSAHQADAQRFLAWLTRPDGGQRIIAESVQYPVVDSVRSKVGLAPLSTLKAPRTDGSDFAGMDKAKELMIEAGLV